ncbi:hypothetical protein D3C74_49010 [compost metagenome]
MVTKVYRCPNCNAENAFNVKESIVERSSKLLFCLHCWQGSSKKEWIARNKETIAKETSEPKGEVKMKDAFVTKGSLSVKDPSQYLLELLAAIKDVAPNHEATDMVSFEKDRERRQETTTLEFLSIDGRYVGCIRYTYHQDTHFINYEIFTPTHGRSATVTKNFTIEPNAMFQISPSQGFLGINDGTVRVRELYKYEEIRDFEWFDPDPYLELDPDVVNEWWVYYEYPMLKPDKHDEYERFILIPISVFGDHISQQ